MSTPDQLLEGDVMTMTHPQGEGATRAVTRQAFESIWRGKGWTEVLPEQALAVAVTSDADVPTVTDLHRLTVAQLQELPGARGMPANAGKEKMIEAIEAAAAGQQL